MILAKSMVLFTAAFLTFSAYASGVSGKVTNVSVRNDGLIWFSVSPVSGARTALPPCVAAYAQSLFTVPNEGTSTAKQQLAILMSAKITGRAVAVTGSGACTRWGDIEDANEINFYD